MNPETEHRINLSRQWEIAGQTQDKKSVRIDLADLCTLRAQTMPIRLQRKFNLPTGLDEDSIVRLEFLNFPNSFPSNGTVELNEQRLSLSPVTDNEFETEDISVALNPFNELKLELASVDSTFANDSVASICLRIKEGA